MKQFDKVSKEYQELKVEKYNQVYDAQKATEHN